MNQAIIGHTTSMGKLREAIFMSVEMKELQAEAKILSRVVDEAIVLADKPEIQHLSAEVKAFKLSGVDSNTLAAYMQTRVLQNVSKSITQGLSDDDDDNLAPA